MNTSNYARYPIPDTRHPIYATRYIVVGLQRSGTTVVHICLGGHPEVSALNDEMKILPFFTKGISTFTFGADIPEEKEKGFLALFDAITSIGANGKTKARGFKVATTSPDKAALFVECLKYYLKDIKVILVERKDLVAQYASLLRAQATGQFHSWMKSNKKSKFSLKINNSFFKKYAFNCLQTLYEFKRLSDTHEVYEVSYEDDILPGKTENYYELFDFLGLPRQEITWLNNCKKVAPSPRDYITNYDELQGLLAEIKNQEEALIASYLKNKESLTRSAKRAAKWQKIRKHLKEIYSVIKE